MVATQAHAATRASTLLGRAPQVEQNAVCEDGMPQGLKDTTYAEGGEDMRGRKSRHIDREVPESTNGGTQQKPEPWTKSMNDHVTNGKRERHIERARNASEHMSRIWRGIHSCHTALE